MNDWYWLPQLASQHGAALDHTLGLVHWLMLVLFVGWGAFFAYVLWRFRAQAQPGRRLHGRHQPRLDLARGRRGASSRRSCWSASRSRSGPTASTRFPPPADATRVRVVAEQFAWNIHYPGPDGVFGRTDVKLIDAQSNPLGLDRNDPAAKDDVTTINQLHLPVGRPGARPAQQQGRDPLLRAAGDARQAGRGPGDR